MAFPDPAYRTEFDDRLRPVGAVHADVLASVDDLGRRCARALTRHLLECWRRARTATARALDEDAEPFEQLDFAHYSNSADRASACALGCQRRSARPCVAAARRLRFRPPAPGAHAAAVRACASWHSAVPAGHVIQPRNDCAAEGVR